MGVSTCYTTWINLLHMSDNFSQFVNKHGYLKPDIDLPEENFADFTQLAAFSHTHTCSCDFGSQNNNYCHLHVPSIRREVPSVTIRPPGIPVGKRYFCIDDLAELSR